MDLIERAAEHLEKNRPGLLKEGADRDRRNGGSDADADTALDSAGNASFVGARGDGRMDILSELEPDPAETPLRRQGIERRGGPATAGGLPTPPKNGPQNGSSRGSRQIELDFSVFSKNGVLLPFGRSTQVTEEFRHIKRDVLALRGVEDLENANMVMVTSASPGEGKTHTAINLAMSIASERDLTALLIDADFTRPRVLDRLGVSADRGLIDLLDDPSLDVSDVILKTNIETLSVIPAGPRHQRSTELLSSRRMDQLADEIARRYNDRVIIFDTAPLLATTEPAALVRHVGQILIVVEAEKTSKGALSSAVEMVKGHQGVGFVLNKVRPQFGSMLGGGYYNYYSYEKNG